jgi:hypothetical protein
MMPKRLLFSIAFVALPPAMLVWSTSRLTAGTIPGATTATANSDDYSGPFADNGNKLTLGRQNIETLEFVVPVVSSGGVTEYALTMGGTYSNFETLTRFNDDYRLEIGFGKGANFVSASSVFPPLDFDAPLPSSPALPPTLGIPQFPFAALKEHKAHEIVWAGQNFLGEFSFNSFFNLSVDAPDLPASVMTHYQPGDLPAGFPDGAQAFTIRGFIVPIPEPSAFTLALCAFVGCCVFIGRSRYFLFRHTR